MKLASYVGTRDGIMGIGNVLIRARLRGRVSHCEIVFEPGDGVDHLMPDGTCEPDAENRLWCFSSVGLERLPSYSPRRANSIGGCRFKRIHVRDWTKWELDDAKAQPLLSARLAVDLQGVLYDWQYIAGFIAWPIPNKDDRLACSEACAAVLGYKEPFRYDPCSLQTTVRNQ